MLKLLLHDIVFEEQLFSCSSRKINEENVPRIHFHNQNFWCFGLQLFASKKMTSQDITKSDLISKIKNREIHFIMRILMCGFTKNCVLGEEFDKIQGSIFVTEKGIVQAYFNMKCFFVGFVLKKNETVNMKERFHVFIIQKNCNPIFTKSLSFVEKYLRYEKSFPYKENVVPAHDASDYNWLTGYNFIEMIV